MRLLLRANAHRPVSDGAVEVAASPDTYLREAWRWQVRLLDADAPPSPVDVASAVARLEVLLAVGSRLEVLADPAAVHAVAEVLAAPGSSGSPAGTLARDTGEVVVLVCAGGDVVVEGRHVLGDRDALVLAGDDPLLVALDWPAGSVADLGVVRLRPVGAPELTWVP
jgi:hypothetical protein